LKGARHPSSTNEITGNDYATTTHWFALPGVTDNGQLTPVEARQEIVRPWTDPDNTVVPESKSRAGSHLPVK
jgi:hypothetical protein